MFEEINIKYLPRDANIISRNKFFVVNNDGTDDWLKRKCSLVPHGNRDIEKEKKRKDSMKAQLPIYPSEDY